MGDIHNFFLNRSDSAISPNNINNIFIDKRIKEITSTKTDSIDEICILTNFYIGISLLSFSSQSHKYKMLQIIKSKINFLKSEFYKKIFPGVGFEDANSTPNLKIIEYELLPQIKKILDKENITDFDDFNFEKFVHNNFLIYGQIYIHIIINKIILTHHDKITYLNQLIDLIKSSCNVNNFIERLCLIRYICTHLGSNNNNIYCKHKFGVNNNDDKKIINKIISNYYYYSPCPSGPKGLPCPENPNDPGSTGNTGRQGQPGSTAGPGQLGITAGPGSTAELGITGSTGQIGSTGDPSRPIGPSGLFIGMPQGYHDLISSANAASSAVNLINLLHPSKKITPIPHKKEGNSNNNDLHSLSGSTEVTISPHPKTTLSTYNINYTDVISSANAASVAVNLINSLYSSEESCYNNSKNNNELQTKINNTNNIDTIFEKVRNLESETSSKIHRKFNEYLECIFEKNNIDQLFCLIKYIIEKNNFILKYIIKKLGNSSILNKFTDENKNKFDKFIISNQNKNKFIIFEETLNKARNMLPINIKPIFDYFESVFDKIDDKSYKDFLKYITGNNNYDINLENVSTSFKKLILLVLNELKYYFIILRAVLYSKNTILYNQLLYMDIYNSLDFYSNLVSRLLININDKIFIQKLNKRTNELLNIKNYDINNKINSGLDIKNFISNLEKNNGINKLLLEDKNTQYNISKKYSIFEVKSLHKIIKKYTDYLNYIFEKNNIDQLFCLIKYIINKNNLLLKYIIKKNIGNNSQKLSIENKNKFDKIIISSENKDKFNIFEKNLNNSRKMISIDITDKIYKLEDIFNYLKHKSRLSYNDFLNLLIINNINLNYTSQQFKDLISLLLNELQYYFIILTAIFNDKNKVLYNNLFYTDVIIQWEFYIILIKKILEKIDNRLFNDKLSDKIDEIKNIKVYDFDSKINLTIKSNKNQRQLSRGIPPNSERLLSDVNPGSEFAGGGNKK